MSCDIQRAPFTDEQKGQICGILSIGCDRQTAASVVGCLAGDIRHAMLHDSTFAESVRRAEGGAELNHMRNVQQAAKDEKNWRASVWWLERHAPERFGPRGAGVVTSRQLKAFVAILVDCLLEDIRDTQDRHRIIARMRAIADSVDQLLREQVMCHNELASAEIALAHDGEERAPFGP
jgi:hypothetical protein